MGYRVLGNTEQLFQGFGPRRGLEGPFIFAGGRVLYYDPKEGKYYDPRCDFYVDHEEMNELNSNLMQMLAK